MESCHPEDAEPVFDQGTAPSDALRTLLLAFSVMGGSSSSVEQAFSKAMKNISPQSCGSVASEQILTKINLECDAYAGQYDAL